MSNNLNSVLRCEHTVTVTPSRTFQVDNPCPRTVFRRHVKNPPELTGHASIRCGQRGLRAEREPGNPADTNALVILLLHGPHRIKVNLKQLEGKANRDSLSK